MLFTNARNPTRTHSTTLLELMQYRTRTAVVELMQYRTMNQNAVSSGFRQSTFNYDYIHEKSSDNLHAVITTCIVIQHN